MINNEDPSELPEDHRDDQTGMDYSEDPQTNSPLTSIVGKWSDAPNSANPNNGARPKTTGQRALTYVDDSPPLASIRETRLETRPPPVVHNGSELPAVTDEVADFQDPLSTTHRVSPHNSSFHEDFPQLPQPKFLSKRGASSPAPKEPFSSRFKSGFARTTRNKNFKGKK